MKMLAPCFSQRGKADKPQAMDWIHDKAKRKDICRRWRHACLSREGEKPACLWHCSGGGVFSKGDIVSVCKREDRTVFARGLTNYSSEEIEKIKGCSTSSIAKVLGYKLYDEVIHRDNMVIL